MRILPTIAALASLAGCRVTATFSCERDEQCRANGAVGLCEPTGFCSFADGDCPSGRRYHEHAGEHGGLCTPVTMPDAAPIDAPFSIARCPPAYTVTLASTSSTSRYRVFPAAGTFWIQEPRCNETLDTHAVVLDTLQEASELDSVLDTMPGPLSYIGAVQDPSAAAPDRGWIDFHGKPLVGTWAQDEPDDNGDGEADHAEQIAVIDRQAGGLRDTNGGGNFAIVCECDGEPIAAMARLFVDTDPRNPN